APPDMTLFPFPRGDLDITDTEALAATVREVRPDVVINAAAYTAVDRAESEAEAAFRVNGAAVGELGRIAREAGARVIHFSTDYVFDGTSAEPYTEESPPNPLNVYGASKLAGVIHVANAGVATWYDVARRVYAAGGAARLVQPCSTAQFPTPARRPARAVLGIARSEQALGGPLRPWEEAIDRFLAEIEVRP